MSSRGITLPELLLCLVLAGVFAQFAIGPVRRQSDALVLGGVREELIGLLHRARSEARARGEARVVIEEGQDPTFIPTAGGSVVRVPISSRGVDLEILGPRSSVEVHFGPLGIAQFASTTLVLRRGRAESRIVLSAYGRIRRESP